MDDVWSYGGDATSIFETISKGRPNGMPAFGNRIPKDQIWALAAYVRSIAGVTCPWPTLRLKVDITL